MCICVLLLQADALAGSQSAAITRGHAEEPHRISRSAQLCRTLPPSRRTFERNAHVSRTEALQKRGFTTHRLDNPAGRPMLLAELNGGQASAPTILFYAHFDGQPIVKEQWAQKDPFEPVVKQRTRRARGRKSLASVCLPPFDPELRGVRALGV